MPTLLHADLVRDALTRLSGWTGDTAGIGRTFHLSPGEYSEFVERLKVSSDAMKHHPDVQRIGNRTQVWLCSPDEGGVTECDITLAARIDYILKVLASRPRPAAKGLGPRS